MDTSVIYLVTLMFLVGDVLIFVEERGYLNCVDLMFLFEGNMSAIKNLEVSGALSPKMQQGWMDNG